MAVSFKEDNEKLSIEQYLKLIKLLLDNVTENCKTPAECKIHLKMKLKFTSSKETDEQGLMHYTGDNIKIKTGNKTNEVIKELF